MGALRSFFVYGRDCAHFLFFEVIMKKSARILTHAAIIAAVYAVMTHLQYILLPQTVSGMIQFRASEALMVLAFFTPAAVPGLTVGCLLANIIAGATPLDFLVGSAATLLAAEGMWLTRRVRIKKYPLPGLLMPALFNGMLVGWELAAYVGGGFWLNAGYVAIGEVAVLLTLGSLLYVALRRRGLHKRLFGRR